MLDPGNEFNVERTLTKEDVQKLIQVCVCAGWESVGNDIMLG